MRRTHKTLDSRYFADRWRGRMQRSARLASFDLGLSCLQPGFDLARRRGTGERTFSRSTMTTTKTQQATTRFLSLRLGLPPLEKH